ncbi:MAG TPA: MMPL family transporter, partial [Ilumatobacteraceae bacterium]|nr:MMPL family transporter [Ilumatobacteraceae bacterium]
MFTTLGQLVVRRRRTVLVTTLLGLIVAIVLGSGVFAGLTNGGFDDPASESTRAIATLDDEFDTGSADLVVIVTAASGSVDDPEVVAAGRALTEEFAAIEGVDDVASYWSLGSAPPLRSAQGDRALILMRFPGAEEDPERVETIEFVLDEYAGLERPGIGVGLAGTEAVFAAIGETIEGDLVRAESIAVPLTLLLLLFVFGG